MRGSGAAGPCGASLRYLFSREAPQPHSLPFSPRTGEEREAESLLSPAVRISLSPLCQVLRGKGVTLARGNLAMGLFLIPALLEEGSGVVSDRHRLGQAAGRAEAEGWMFPSQAASLSLSVSPPVGREAGLMTAETRSGADDRATPRRCRFSHLRSAVSGSTWEWADRGKDLWPRRGDEFKLGRGSDPSFPPPQNERVDN